jgi:predicted transcriptional regulator
MKKLHSKSVAVDARVEEAMGEPFPVVRRGETILDPFNIMKDMGAMLVVDGTVTVGIITVIDVVNYLAKKQ